MSWLNSPQNTGLLHNGHLRSGFSFDTFTPSLARHSEVEITGKQKGPRESQIIVFDLKELNFSSKFKYEPMYQGGNAMVQIQRMSRLLSGLFFRAIYINKRIGLKRTGTVTPPNDLSDLNGSTLIWKSLVFRPLKGVCAYLNVRKEAMSTVWMWMWELCSLEGERKALSICKITWSCPSAWPRMVCYLWQEVCWKTFSSNILLFGGISRKVENN